MLRIDLASDENSTGTDLNRVVPFGLFARYRAPVEHLVVHRAVTREVVSS